MDEPELLDLIDAIYAAVTEPERWPAVLDRISAEFSQAAILIGRMTRGTVCDLMLRHRFPLQPALDFQHSFGVELPPPFIVALPSRALAEPLTPEAVEGEERFLTSDVYRQIMAPHGLRYLTSAVLHREPGWLTYASLWRGPESHPFKPQELARFGWFARHLGRAVALQHSLAAANARGALLADIIDRFDRGAIVVDCHGRLVLANKMAEAILARGDGLLMSGDRVTARGRSCGATLKQLVEECAATSSGAGAEAGGMLKVPRDTGERDYAVMVSPLSAAMLAGVSDPALALLLVSDPEKRLPAPHQLAQLHGFTAAEARLAVQLLAGQTPAEAARVLGISITTVRYHLRNLLAKTGTRRQAELLALLAATSTD